MRIKEVIKEKGLTVEKVASRMGVKSPSLSRAINGNTTVEMLNRIAKALEVPVTELFESDESDLYGLVIHKGKVYKVDSLTALETLYKEVKK